jgi:hypothetical protein
MRIVQCSVAASVLMFAGLLDASEPVAAQSNLRSSCSMNFAMIGRKNSAELLRGLIFDKVPPQPEALAITPRSATSSVVYQLPFSEADYKTVFGKEAVSVTEKTEIESAKRFFIRSGLSENKSIKNSETFNKYLKESTSQNIIVVGHNESGHFSFLDGTPSEIWSLSEDCARARKNCIFISCRSKDYVAAGSLGVKRDLTFEEGIYIAEKIHDWLNDQTSQITDLKLTKFISETQTKAHFKYHVAYIAMNGCEVAAGGTVLYIVVQGVRE